MTSYNEFTLARIKDASDINSPDTALAAVKGTARQILVEEELSKAKLVTTEDYDEAVDLAIQDKVDALVADYPICLI